MARATDFTKMTTLEMIAINEGCRRHSLRQTHLVELQRIEKLVQLSVLLHLLEIYVVLLQSMQSKLRFVVHENFQRLYPGSMTVYVVRSWKTYARHEFLAGDSNVLCQRRRKHHDLLVVRSDPENLLHIAAHV